MKFYFLWNDYRNQNSCFEEKQGQKSERENNKGQQAACSAYQDTNTIINSAFCILSAHLKKLSIDDLKDKSCW